MAAVDVVNRVFRDYYRYTGDGKPGEPANAPLPIGDRQSGVHSPDKAELRAALLAPLEEMSDEASRAEQEADRAQENADAAAAYAGFRDIADVPGLLSNTSLTYGTGAGQVQPGDVLRSRKEGFSYRIAASTATDHHLTTAGGVKLYVNPTPDRKIRPEMVGAVGDGVADDTAKCQVAIRAAIEAKAAFEYTGNYLLSPVATLPDGHAGSYSLMVDGPLVIDGGGRGSFVVPANQHGILIWDTDDVSVVNGRFVSGPGATGTIGHHIRVLGPCANVVVSGNKFERTSDAAIGLSYDLNAALADPGTGSIFDYGPRDIVVEDNDIDGQFPAGTALIAGDAAIEIQGTSNGTFRNNRIKNMRGHGIRVVGLRGGVIANNRIDDIGIDENFSAAAIAAFSGGAIGALAPNHNSGVSVYDNVGENCFDGIWLGLGSSGFNVIGNEMRVRRYGIQIGHINSISAPAGLRNTIIKDNVLTGGTHSIYLAVSNASPAGSDPLRDVDICGNIFRGYSIAGFFENGAQAGMVSRRSHVRGNRFEPVDSSVTSPASGIQRTYVEDSDMSENVFSFENGGEQRIFTPTGRNRYSRLPRYKFARASNTLAITQSGARRPLQKWQRVTLETTGTLPAGASANAIYYLFDITDTNARIATSEANATAGSGVTLTDAGTGHHYIVPVER